jgi:hypothetical protein
MIDNSSDPDDPHHLKNIIEKPHKLQIISKRKRKNNQHEVEEVMHDEDSLLEDMELDANIEDIKFPNNEHKVQ